MPPTLDLQTGRDVVAALAAARGSPSFRSRQEDESPFVRMLRVDAA
jgi:hypothetical protein